jgi:hypothetical protein
VHGREAHSVECLNASTGGVGKSQVRPSRHYPPHPKMPRFTAASLLLLAPALVSAANCPSVHVFGARETTASPGYGSTASVVTSIVNSYSGATSEVINYPACGGQSSCGGDSYAQSASAGVQAVTSQVNSYNQQCPNTVLVLVGYSQVSLSVCHDAGKTCLTAHHRAARSSTTRTAAAATPTRESRAPPSPSPPPRRRRLLLPSSWVTPAASLDSLTTPALASRPA